MFTETKKKILYIEWFKFLAINHGEFVTRFYYRDICNARFMTIIFGIHIKENRTFERFNIANTSTFQKQKLFTEI